MDDKDTIKNVSKTSNRDKYLNEKNKFKKGNPGGPGRPAGVKGFSISELIDAIEEVEVEKDEKLYKKFVNKAYVNPTVLIALIKKLIPDKTHTEIKGVGDTDIIILSARESFKKKLDDISKRLNDIGKNTNKQSGRNVSKATGESKK